jgi:hypothetical protein
VKEGINMQVERMKVAPDTVAYADGAQDKLIVEFAIPGAPTETIDVKILKDSVDLLAPARDIEYVSALAVGWPTMTQLLPNLATSEDEEQQHEIGFLSHANVYAGTLVGGPLLNMLTAGEATEVRLMNAIDALSETQTPESEAVGDDVLELLNQRTLWAYRLGLMVGLRLARAD